MRHALSLILLLLFCLSVNGQTTQKKVAVIVYNLADQPFGHTVDEVRSLVFTGSSSVNAYYLESSYGQLGITGAMRPDGDVFGVYTTSGIRSVCSGTDFAEAKARAVLDGYVESDYFATVYLFPASACNYSNSSFGPIIWVSDFALHAIAHELGHSLGIAHANSYSCAAGETPPYCSYFNTYGDVVGGVMGAGTNQLNNYNRGVLGFLSPSQTKTITASGDYTLEPIEFPNGVTSIRIPRNPGSYYYLEFRQPSGVFDKYQPTDARTQGISIRIAGEYTSGTETYAMTGGSIGGGLIWAVNDTFTDVPLGISITPTEISPTGATIRIAFDPAACKLQVPSITVSPSNQSDRAGATLSYTVTVRNPNIVACPAQTYTVVPQLASRWSQSPLSYSITLAYGQSDTRDVGITSPRNSKVGSYIVYQNVNLNRKSYSKAAAVYSVTGP